jgi:MoxR-like ATPase
MLQRYKIWFKRNQLKNEIAKVIVGQDAVVDQILICIFSGGHALLVGVLDWLKH